MCLKVFCNGDEAQYTDLEASARSLGAAFQKVNFLRDVQADYEERGRVYFPGVNFDNFQEINKREIEEDIERDFNAAFQGIKRLPKTSRFGVYVAYKYYLQLFRKIESTPGSKILSTRIRIPNAKKYLISLTSYLKFQMNML